MITMRLRALAWCWMAVFGLLSATQATAASPAGVQGENLPMSQSSGHFSPWRKMQPSSYAGTVDSALGQCYRSVFSAPDWLNSERCQRLSKMLKAEQCKEKWVKDGHKLDLLNGRVNGDPKQEAKTWRNQEKHTGRLDRALWCDLGGGVHAYWFTGVVGQSCNNVGFVHVKPRPKPAVAKTVLPFSPMRFVPHTGVVGNSRIEYVPSLQINNCCSACPTYIPGTTVIIQDGSGLNSNGGSFVDW